MSDKELYQLCIKDDAKAQYMLYDKYAIPMIRLCQRYLGNEDLAEEVMIKGFYKVFSKLKEFEWRHDNAFAAWMKRIMVNESLMQLRQMKKHSADQDLTNLNISNSDFAENGILSEQIHALVQQLPQGYRTVFNMYVVEGYSHKEIASQLHIQENTSKSQLSKARTQLKKWITNLDML